MFTGIVEELGRVRSMSLVHGGARLSVSCTTVLDDVVDGASIAVDGACLTVVAHGEGWWTADVVDETLARTTLGMLAPGQDVNLERPLRLADRLGGHLVQGHVDGVGLVSARDPASEGSVRLRIEVPPALRRYQVEKGSVAVDGVSLTVAALTPTGFEVAVIPHTLAVTTLGARNVGDPVNLEVDVLAKHVEQLLAGRDRQEGPADIGAAGGN